MGIQSDLDKIKNLLDRMIDELHLSVNSCGCCNQADKAKTMSLAMEAEQMITLIIGR